MIRLLSSLLASLLAACVACASGFPQRFEELKKSAAPEELYAFLYDMPKGGDLHNHAGGSNLPEWLYAVATDPKRNGGDTFYTRIRFSSPPDAIADKARFHTIRQYTYDRLPPDIRAEYLPLSSLTDAERAAWCSAFVLDEPGEGRDEFFDTIWLRFGDTLRNPHLVAELLVENMKAFGAEGVRYLETQLGVSGFFSNDGQPMPVEESIALLEARINQPDALATDMTVRFQNTVLRFHADAEKQLEKLYAFNDAHRDRWVGLNMAGIEERGPGYPRRFLETYRRLRARHPTLKLSIHAGEMDGPDSHIRDTLLLGASRIGHGINLIKDEPTLLLLQQTRHVLVEINLISNRLLEYTPDLSGHPFPEYLRTGIPVCLNTDDRGIWHSNMTDEYYTAVTLFNLSWEELVTMGRNSLSHSFAQPEVKQRLLADYEKRLAAFVSRHEAGAIADTLARLATIRPEAYGYARRTWGIEFR